MLLFRAEFYRHKFLPKSKKGNRFLQNFWTFIVAKVKKVLKIPLKKPSCDGNALKNILRSINFVTIKFLIFFKVDFLELFLLLF